MRIWMTVVLLGLGACGQKGQLYLPGPEESMVNPAPEQAAEPQAEQTVAPAVVSTDEPEEEKPRKD